MPGDAGVGRSDWIVTMVIVVRACVSQSSHHMLKEGHGLAWLRYKYSVVSIKRYADNRSHLRIFSEPG